MATDEAKAWTGEHEPDQWVPATLARSAVDYWIAFFGPLERKLGGADIDISEAAKAALLRTVRAVSWVESRHGTFKGKYGSGSRDPMQCGHPRDAWWRVLTVKTKHDYFLLRPPPGPPLIRPRKEGMWAFELAEYVEADPSVSDTVRLKSLGDEVEKGHSSPAFKPPLSYFWAVPLLIQKINRATPRTTYHFGDWEYVPYVVKARHSLRMVEGAVAYNGQGDKNYRTKLYRALADIQSSEG